MTPPGKAVFHFGWRVFALALMSFSVAQAAAEEFPTNNDLPLLTNASQVLSLPAEQAIRSEKVLVNGVVTVADESWGGRFFVQDSSGGVFVENLKSKAPQVGDLVEVQGVTHPGAFAPIITKPVWKKLGTAPLPEARKSPIEQLMAGIDDGQRVELHGYVREAGYEGNRLRVTLGSGGYRLHCFMPIPPGVDPPTLVGAEVRVRGTAAASYNAKLRHLTTMILHIPEITDFVVEQPERVNPYATPILPLNNIAQYRKDAKPYERVRVKGIVTFQRPGQDLFIEDATGGLHIRSLEPQPFRVGDVIEAVGFPEIAGYLPVLEDASFKKTSDPAVSLVPHAPAINTIQAGLHHADYVMLEGTLLDRNLRPSHQSGSTKTAVRTVLLLQSSNFYFTAESETPLAVPQLLEIPIGSRIQVTGVCLMENSDDGKFKSFQILMPTPDSFKILSKPSWITPQRLAIALVIVCLVSLIAISWIVMISRKNIELNVQIREKENAQDELQNAHDLLEKRVIERTEQLKVQIAARHESELQFKGAVAERTRLAQELHDTLEQTLASIALQMDTCAKLINKDLEKANYHFEIGRNILAQSQVDVRRSVWDLRSRALEQFSLKNALLHSSKQITQGTSIQVEVKTSGIFRALTEIVEENLLRIAQEALTNIVKHADASHTLIDIHYGVNTVTMQVTDDGKGFALDGRPGPDEGHFGLLGMSERIQRVGGKIDVTSAPGEGTRIKIEIPIGINLEQYGQPETLKPS